MIKTVSGKSRRTPAEVNPTTCRAECCIPASWLPISPLSLNYKPKHRVASYFNIFIIPKKPWKSNFRLQSCSNKSQHDGGRLLSSNWKPRSFKCPLRNLWKMTTNAHHHTYCRKTTTNTTSTITIFVRIQVWPVTRINKGWVQSNPVTSIP